MIAVLIQDFLRFAASAGYFRLRAILVGLPLLILVITTATISSFSSVSGEPLLGTAAYSILLLLLLVQPGLIAPILVAERTQNRLDVVRSTPLSGWGLVLGRYLSRIALSGTMVVSVMPLMAFSILYGGVSRTQVLQCCALMPLVVLWVSAAALAISSVAKSQTSALRISYGGIIAFLVLMPSLPSLGMGLGSFSLQQSLLSLHAMSPLTVLTSILAGGLVFAPPGDALLGHAVFSLIVVATAIPFSVWRMGRDPRRRGLGSTGRKLVWRPSLQQKRPLLWLELRPQRSNVPKVAAVWIGIALIEAIWAESLPWGAPTPYTAMSNHISAIEGWFLLGSLMTAIHAAASFHDGASAQTMEVLHSCPVSSRSLLKARILGIARASRLWWALELVHMVVAGALGVIPIVNLLLWLVIQIILVLALINTALFLSLESPNARRAIAKTLSLMGCHLALTPLLGFCLIGSGGIGAIGLILGHHPVMIAISVLSAPTLDDLGWLRSSEILSALLPAALYLIMYVCLAFRFLNTLVQHYERRRQQNWRNPNALRTR